ncbi:MAG TPA: aminotransferase class V-fold PLP-dependent enzyme [Candidatus Obscuribacterales bacterium]
MKNPAVIYLDNAATSHPKPEDVYAAADLAFRGAGSAGRGAHRLALEASRTVFEVRTKLAKFLGAPSAERLIFTSGCTQSLNMVLKGLTATKAGASQQRLLEGDAVVVSPLEHNAVMRPLNQLAGSLGIKVLKLNYAPGKVFDVAQLKEMLNEHKPKLVVTIEGSNITGEVADIAATAALCDNYGVPLVVDAAQTAGILPIDLSLPGLTFWCASAHKGLLGQSGLGLLYAAPGWDLEPLIAGGTGSASESLAMPSVHPDHLEAGTKPLPAIAALGAAVTWLENTGVESIYKHELTLAERFCEYIEAHDFLRTVTPRGEGGRRIANVSFSVDGLTVDRVADILDREYGIAVRAGLHCAALAHETLGTRDSGLVRASFGWFNTLADVDSLTEALTAMHAKSAAKKTRV